MEAEREERERWITREQQKIMDSVYGKLNVLMNVHNMRYDYTLYFVVLLLCGLILHVPW